MKALCWNDKHDVRVEEVPDPEIEQPHDAIIRITSTAICGSDLHIYNGLVKGMLPGDVLGHEPMGEVVEVGRDVKNLTVGDRVVVPFTISCGNCWFCNHQLFSCCDTSNPNPKVAAEENGFASAGLFGYSHTYGGFNGGQAQYMRVPFADVGPIKIPKHLADEQVLFLSDIFPTGYMAAENCNIEPDDIVAVWGAGPVGQFCVRSAFLLGASRVIVIDDVPERLWMAEQAGAEIINNKEISPDDVFEQLKFMTGGFGPDACIDAVGLEGHGHSVRERLDQAKMTAKMATDKPDVLRQALYACRKGGTVSVPGVYTGLLDKIPFGAAMSKALTIKTGQTHVQAYTEKLLHLIEAGKIDPSFVVTHELTLREAPQGYKTFLDKDDECIKVVIKPWQNNTAGKVKTFPKNA